MESIEATLNSLYNSKVKSIFCLVDISDDGNSVMTVKGKHKDIVWIKTKLYANYYFSV